MLVVEATGPGRLYLLSISDSKKHKTLGYLDGWTRGKTKFHVGFSHHFNRYMLYYDGVGETVAGPMSSMQRQRLGASWNDAIEVDLQGRFCGVNVSVPDNDPTVERVGCNTTIYLIRNK
jgi:hypothetical protein